jgi:hypothetical protein
MYIYCPKYYEHLFLPILDVRCFKEAEAGESSVVSIATQGTLFALVLVPVDTCG